MWKTLWENTYVFKLTNGNKGTYNEMTQSSANGINSFATYYLKLFGCLSGQRRRNWLSVHALKVRFPQLFDRVEAHYIWGGR